MTDDGDAEVGAQLALGDIAVMVGCPGCRWNGIVRLYDIGDGPEWCCPACDLCWPSEAEVGEDGLTKAERNMRVVAAEHQQKWGER